MKAKMNFVKILLNWILIVVLSIIIAVPIILICMEIVDVIHTSFFNGKVYTKGEEDIADFDGLGFFLAGMSILTIIIWPICMWGSYKLIKKYSLKKSNQQA